MELELKEGTASQGDQAADREAELSGKAHVPMTARDMTALVIEARGKLLLVEGG